MSIKKKPDYKWVIVVVCFLMVFCGMGFGYSNKSLYLGAITSALNIKRSLFSFNDCFRFLTTATINLFFGRLIKKLGARKMIAIGYVCFISAVLIYAYAETIYLFYVGGILLGVSMAFSTTTVISSLIKRWVKENTGTVLGFVLAGNGLGSAVAAQIVTPIIYEEGNPFGYRNAYRLVAVILIVVGIMAVLFIRESPKNDNSVPVAHKKNPRGGGWVGVDYETAKKTPFFYTALVGIFITGVVLQGINTAGATHMRDTGIEAGYLATVLSVHSLVLMGAKFFTGFSYDRFGLRPTILICQIAGVVGLVAMALIDSSPVGMTMAMLWGILSSVALPLETIMLSLITTDLFGNKAFDKILGVISAVNVAGYAVGAPLGNICFDIFGSYVPFIWVSAGLMVVVTVMYQLIINAANKNRAEVLAAENAKNGGEIHA